MCAHTQSRIFLRTPDNRILDNIHKVSMFKIIKDVKEEIKILRNIFGKKNRKVLIEPHKNSRQKNYPHLNL